MNVRPLTRDEVRSIDQIAADEYGLSTLVLMENAGRGAAQIIRDVAKPRSRIVIFCGAGNNGGDGGVAARFLDSWGFRVTVIWFAPPEKIAIDARVQHDILKCAELDQHTCHNDIDMRWLRQALRGSDWIVDGILGTGLTQAVREPVRSVIEIMNQAGTPILALDLPSGLDADSGHPLGIAVKATITATFVAPKTGFSQPDAAQYTGRVEVVEIGVPRKILQSFFVSSH
jgi:NAD(P)H-hydrate epimerase